MDGEDMVSYNGFVLLRHTFEDMVSSGVQPMTCFTQLSHILTTCCTLCLSVLCNLPSILSLS